MARGILELDSVETALVVKRCCCLPYNLPVGFVHLNVQLACFHELKGSNLGRGFLVRQGKPPYTHYSTIR